MARNNQRELDSMRSAFSILQSSRPTTGRTTDPTIDETDPLNISSTSSRSPSLSMARATTSSIPLRKLHEGAEEEKELSSSDSVRAKRTRRSGDESPKEEDSEKDQRGNPPKTSDHNPAEMGEEEETEEDKREAAYTILNEMVIKQVEYMYNDENNHPKFYPAKTEALRQYITVAPADYKIQTLKQQLNSWNDRFKTLMLDPLTNADESNSYHHRNPNWDKFFGLKKTQSWQNHCAGIRQEASEQLLTILGNIESAETAIALLRHACTLPLFKEHRSNFVLTGAWGKTSTVAVFEKEIVRLSKLLPKEAKEQKHQNLELKEISPAAADEQLPPALAILFTQAGELQNGKQELKFESKGDGMSRLQEMNSLFTSFTTCDYLPKQHKPIINQIRNQLVRYILDQNGYFTIVDSRSSSPSKYGNDPKRYQAAKPILEEMAKMPIFARQLDTGFFVSKTTQAVDDINTRIKVLAQNYETENFLNLDS